jgi:hypothetical protein
MSSDLSESSLEEDQLADEPELLANQPTIEAAKSNLINPNAWTPISTGPPRPVPPEHRVPPELRNLKPPPKRKQPAHRLARIRINVPKAPKAVKEKDPPKKKGPVVFSQL